MKNDLSLKNAKIAENTKSLYFGSNLHQVTEGNSRQNSKIQNIANVSRLLMHSPVAHLSTDRYLYCLSDVPNYIHTCTTHP